MKCYRCGGERLSLAPLSIWECDEYRELGIVLRVCCYCGLEQNHAGDDEPLGIDEAINRAPTVLTMEGPR